ncbi:MAG: hypothetical protein WDW38_002917 [Sanguina aurantia]
MHRVKVYKLDEAGSWADWGTGHISIQQADAMGLIIVSEDESTRTLLIHKISLADIYTRSGEHTIITWQDPDSSIEVAISFQDPEGCQQIWDNMMEVQREATAKNDRDTAELTLASNDEFEHHIEPSDDMEMGPAPFELPPVAVKNLEEIAKTLAQVLPYQRERLASQLMKADYLPSLLDLFKQCEDVEDADSLSHFYVIMRGAIMLNDTGLLEELLSEKHCMDVLGALEYDPEQSQPQRHRDFLHAQVVFKEVVPITNTDVVSRIHQTYRIQYIKDVVLPRSLDDATYATLSSLAMFNNIDVMGSLLLDADFLPQLFARLQAVDPETTDWADLVAFLQELCNLARHLQQQQKQLFFQRVGGLGLFEVVTRVMTLGRDDAIKLKATDVLMSLLQHDVSSLRTSLMRQPGNTLFGCLVSELVEGSAGGLPDAAADLIKALLDPETMDTAAEKNDFVELFYDRYMEQLLGVFTADSSICDVGTRVVAATTLSLVVELMCFCVQSHTYRIKYLALRANAMQKVLSVARRRERWLVCAAVRFLRVVIGMRDEFFNRYIIKQSLFEPIFSAFFANGERYNLINSAVLELMEFVRKESTPPLIEHLVTTYQHLFADIDYVPTFRLLKQRYDQTLDAHSNGGNSNGNASADPDRSNTAPASASGGGSGDATAAGGPLAGRRITFQLGSEAGAAAAPVAGGAGRGRGLLGVRRRQEDRGLDRDEEDYFSEDVQSEEEEDDSSVEPIVPERALPLQQQRSQQQLQSPTAIGSAPPTDMDTAEAAHANASPPSPPSTRSFMGLVDYDDDDPSPVEAPRPSAGTGSSPVHTTGSGSSPGPPPGSGSSPRKPPSGILFSAAGGSGTAPSGGPVATAAHAESGGGGSSRPVQQPGHVVGQSPDVGCRPVERQREHNTSSGGGPRGMDWDLSPTGLPSPSEPPSAPLGAHSAPSDIPAASPATTPASSGSDNGTPSPQAQPPAGAPKLDSPGHGPSEEQRGAQQERLQGGAAGDARAGVNGTAQCNGASGHACSGSDQEATQRQEAAAADGVLAPRHARQQGANAHKLEDAAAGPDSKQPKAHQLDSPGSAQRGAAPCAPPSPGGSAPKRC